VTIRIAITGPKGVGKTVIARAIKSFLGDTCGYDVALKDEGGENAAPLTKEQLFKLSDQNLHFKMPVVEVYSNIDEKETLSTRELSERIRRIERHLGIG
jgi:hypothetical protein